MSDSHIRLNKVTREWAIYAPSRRLRPQNCRSPDAIAAPTSACDLCCPFCTFPNPDEPILLELPALNGTGWQTRVVPNKFPALRPDGDRERQVEGIYLRMPGYGRHEVIIESPNHNDDLATMPLAAVETAIATYHRRYPELMAIHESMGRSSFAIAAAGRGLHSFTPARKSWRRAWCLTKSALLAMKPSATTTSALAVSTATFWSLSKPTASAS